MNILVQLSHPAHFHFYHNSIKQWLSHGHQVFVLIKTKDILEQLLQASDIPYLNILPHAHRKSQIGIFYDMLIRDFRILKFCKSHDIDLLTGSTPEVAHIGWLLHKPSINVGEDDAAIIPMYVKMTAPFLEIRLSPTATNNGHMEPHSLHFNGYMKLAYLHPNVFTPNREYLKKYCIGHNKDFFILRFANLNAHHDKGVSGINTMIAKQLINLLSEYGEIYITSERPLEAELEKYRLHINPLHIHHIMAYAKLCVSDSQSMSVEAAMLGVPNVRFNDFVGAKKIGVLDELENKYELTCGISSKQPDKLLLTLQKMLQDKNINKRWQERRTKMLQEKIDVSAFFTWFVENYPESAETMRTNPDYQAQFK